ncbi:MAG: lipid A deacylase LpxR family protein [Fluviicola sp.]|nr:lipid A deacylase LpxR family protein [Fluviicola sp.]
MKFLLAICCFVHFHVVGQYIRYTSEISDTARKSCFLQYENDLFVQTDRYYTQGIALNYKTVLPATSFFGGLFFQVPSSGKRMSLGLDQQVFTPTSIRSDSLLNGDRPYAATLHLTSVFETVDTLRHRIFGWQFSLGMIGPAALGKETQTGIHKATNNFLPLGWQHQLNTGLLVDLGAHVNYRVIAVHRWLSLDVNAQANLGTGNTSLLAGGNLNICLINNRLAIGFYTKPALRVVGYDATLQGSLIGLKSEYVVASNRMKRLISEQETGVHLQLNCFSMDFWLRFQSNLFDGAVNHRWGGVRLSFSF